MKHIALRSLSLVMALLMILSASALLFSCKNDNPETPTEAPTEPVTDPATEAPTAAPTEEPTEEPTEPATEEPTEAPTEPETEPPIIDVEIGETIDAPYAADFTVSKVFSDDMVVQRGEHIRVWGWAKESENGKKVSGEFMGMFAEALIENGEWTLTFGARQEANTNGNEMKIYTDKKEVVFKDVLIGDVYMVIGQSNVAYGMNAHWSAVKDADRGGQSGFDPDLPIRLHYNSLGQNPTGAKRGTAEVNVDIGNGSKWRKATMGNVSSFTAIGYLFAANLCAETGNSIPIGLIEIDGNGLPIGSFMCNQVADELKTDTWNESRGVYVTEGCNAGATGQPARYMYNQFMAPFEKFAMAGVVWYQGESDSITTELATSFPTKFAALMTYMRSTHNLCHPDFPVFIVEFPTIYKQSSASIIPAGQSWAYMDLGFVRCQVGVVPLILKNSYLAVSCDVWPDRTFWNSLHPNCKFEQGVRLAKLAACVTEGAMTLDEATGPIIKSIEISEDGKTAVLTYYNVGEGLKTCDGGVDVLGFQNVRVDARGNMRMTKISSAKITAKDQITITCTSAMSGVAYNNQSENFYGETLNLCNSFGNPAGAAFILADKE